METTNATGVRHITTRSGLSLDKIDKSQFQKEGTLTAQIRQLVTTDSYYPSKKTSSDMQANIFSNEDFGFEEQKFTSVETRIAWIPVPENITAEEVIRRLAAATQAGACIYRVLSNAPILDENQKYAVKNGITTLDTIANAQAVRFPENEKTLADGTANKLTLDKAGNVQYRRTFFWKTPMADLDVRGHADHPPYVSPQLKMELEGAAVSQGQTI